MNIHDGLPWENPVNQEAGGDLSFTRTSLHSLMQAHSGNDPRRKTLRVITTAWCQVRQGYMKTIKHPLNMKHCYSMNAWDKKKMKTRVTIRSEEIFVKYGYYIYSK